MSSVPPSPQDGALAEQLDDVLGERRWLVLTGAGMSTDSGIPDYRGPGAPERKPMTLAELRRTESARRRYWARSYLGWPSIRAALPNQGHRALAALEQDGRLSGLITQNVDGLHQAAGHSDVIDLHGRLDQVVCLDCGALSDRGALQDRLADLNPGFGEDGVVVGPDGDVTLEETNDFVLAACTRCDGWLKPDVVFFGERVPLDRVEECRRRVEEAEALVVLGSSLQVYSGRRFVSQAHSRGIPIIIVNRGATRADELATLTLDVGCSEFLAGCLAQS